MVKDRVMFAVSVSMAAVSFIIGVWKGNGMTVGISLTALIVLVPAMVYCPVSVSSYCTLAGLAVLACAVLTATAASETAMVISDIPDDRWTYVLVSAAIYGAAMIPLIPVFLFTVAAVFDTSYNWVIVAGLGWLIGLGLTSPQYLMILVFQNAAVENGVILNTHIVTAMLVSLVMFIVFSVVFSRVMRTKRLLITSKGAEAMR
jgi:hypothetical protein